MDSQPGPIPEEVRPPIAPPPRLTRTETAVWVVFGVVAVGLVLVPLLTRTFSLQDLFSWTLLAGAVTISAIWLRSGGLRCQEWLYPEDYEEFLKELHLPAQRFLQK